MDFWWFEEAFARVVKGREGLGLRTGPQIGCSERGEEFESLRRCDDGFALRE